MNYSLAYLISGLMFMLAAAGAVDGTASPMWVAVLGFIGGILMERNQWLLSQLNDFARLAALKETCLLDTPEEETFDRFTRLASRILQTPVALLSLVDKTRQFFKSSIGLPEPWATERQTPLSHSFCQHVVCTSEILSISDARTHPLVKDNLAIPDLGVIAYLGMPLITSEGHVLGSFCAIDTTPRKWTAPEMESLRDLAALAMEKIELRILANQLHADYLNLRELELHRTEIVQMLVHDLRNPLASYLGGLDLLAMAGDQLSDEQQRYLSIADQGGKRLSKMINSILDASKTEYSQLNLTLSKICPRTIVESV